MLCITNVKRSSLRNGNARRLQYYGKKKDIKLNGTHVPRTNAPNTEEAGVTMLTSHILSAYMIRYCCILARCNTSK
jgi:hypothetical protein